VDGWGEAQVLTDEGGGGGAEAAEECCAGELIVEVRTPNWLRGKVTFLIACFASAPARVRGFKGCKETREPIMHGDTTRAEVTGYAAPATVISLQGSRGVRPMVAADMW